MIFKPRAHHTTSRALTKWLFTLFLLSMLALFASVPAVYAASTITVNTTTDENNTGAGCSLREAITTANTNANYGGCTGAAGGPFSINVPAGTYTLNTAFAASADDALQIGPAGSIDVSITGAGAGTTIITTDVLPCTDGTVRVFNLDPNVLGDVDVTISGVMITNGVANAFGGGAILGGGTGNSLTLTNSTISDNCTAGSNNAAGISWSPDGDVTITNSTFLNNISDQAAGALLFSSTGTLTITDTNFSGNTAAASGSAGGALLLGSTGTFNIKNSTFSSNEATDTAGMGGAIYVGGGTLNLTNSTLNLNSAGDGGGIASAGTLNVINSTLAGNTAATNGGGISNSGTATLKNTIVTASANGNCYVSAGTLTANAFNLANDTTCDSATNSASINLDTLQNNGGPTETMKLLTGSSAIDAADDAVCNAAPVNNLDQRGLTRPLTNCDTGAFEVQSLVCSAGQYDNGGSCVDAPAGYYVDSPGATSPIPCAKGSYQPLTGQTSCNQADAGYFVQNIASVAQSPCASGTTSNAGSSDCPIQSGPNFVVNTTADTDDTECDFLGQGVGNKDCTLREAINAANALAGADTITFNIPVPNPGCIAANVCIITLNSALAALNDNVTIDGAPNAGKITVSGNDAVRVLQVNNGIIVNLTALTIADGNCDLPCFGAGGIDNSGTLNVLNSTFTQNSSGGGTTNPGVGGAIQNKVGATLTVRNSTFADNASLVTGSGGGILNAGALTVINSTFYNNLAASGSGIENSGTANLINSTFSDNVGFGSIENYGTATLYNTIVAAASTACSGTVSADPFNLATDGTCGSATTKTAPQLVLGALGSNGGPTQTMALGSSSVAIDTADPTVCADINTVNNLDQRGKNRNDLRCDVGAFEFVYSDGDTVSKNGLTFGPLYTFGPTLAGVTAGSFYSPTLTIKRELTPPVNSPPANALPITWDATAQTSGFSFLFTLCYNPSVLTGQNENQLHVYHYNGSTWDDLGGNLDDTTHLPYHCVTATTPLSTLSPLALAPAQTTAVNVAGVRGKLTRQGAVRLQWRTVNESFVAGFNVYRKTKTGWEKINANLLSAKQPGTPNGNKYRFKDTRVKSGKTYRYKIEVLYTDNRTQWTEVVKIKTP